MRKKYKKKFKDEWNDAVGTIEIGHTISMPKP